MELTQRLYRSRGERVIAGVCGGLATYFGGDPVLWRIGAIVLTIASGVGLVAYVVAWVIVPEEPVLSDGNSYSPHG